MAKAKTQRPNATTSATYADLQRQIADLQAHAEDVKRQEVAGVVARIREAIGVYGLTPDDLFGPVRQPKARKAAPASAAPKYKDPETGKTWTGVGKRPKWFVAAVEAGADPQTLAA